jgi:hypothetical protein
MPNIQFLQNIKLPIFCKVRSKKSICFLPLSDALTKCVDTADLIYLNGMGFIQGFLVLDWSMIIKKLDWTLDMQASYNAWCVCMYNHMLLFYVRYMFFIHSVNILSQRVNALRSIIQSKRRRIWTTALGFWRTPLLM